MSPSLWQRSIATVAVSSATSAQAATVGKDCSAFRPQRAAALLSQIMPARIVSTQTMTAWSARAGHARVRPDGLFPNVRGAGDGEDPRKGRARRSAPRVGRLEPRA